VVIAGTMMTTQDGVITEGVMADIQGRGQAITIGKITTIHQGQKVIIRDVMLTVAITPNKKF
jgi:hypothetical protein